MQRHSSEKVVKKPWGNEWWLSEGKSTPYALKRILFRSGQRSSLQVHQHKIETNYVLDGSGLFLISSKPIDVEAWLRNPHKEVQLAKIIEDLVEIVLAPETIVDVPAGYVHRVIASTDLTFIECSTTELDDVIRLVDDSNRGHGRISSEHI